MRSDDRQKLEELASELGTTVCDPAKVDPFINGVVSNSLRSFDEMVEARAGKTRPGHKVCTGYLNDTSFNAVAALIDGDIIALNVGVPQLLNKFFHAAFANPDFLPWIGDQTKEDASRAAFLTGKSLLQGLQNSTAVSPRDKARSTAASFMADTSLFWVFQHELGHIWNGHVDLVQGISGLRRIEELRLIGSTGLQPLDIRTLEFDADAFATSNIITQAEPAFQDRNLHLLGASTDITTNGWERYISYIYVTIALHLQFRLFGEETASAEDAASALHPPPTQRTASCAAVIVTALIREGLSEDDACALVRAAASTAEHAFALALGIEPADTIWGWGEQSAAADRELLRNWHRLYPDLDKLKRGGRLAPPQDWAFDETI